MISRLAPVSPKTRLDAKRAALASGPFRFLELDPDHGAGAVDDVVVVVDDVLLLGAALIEESAAGAAEDSAGAVVSVVVVVVLLSSVAAFGPHAERPIAPALNRATRAIFPNFIEISSRPKPPPNAS